MSYAAAAALQTAVFQRLSSAPALAGVSVHDALPAGAGLGTFVLIGPEEARDRSDQTGSGADHRLTISVISDADGFLSAKMVASAVSDVLQDAPLTLTRGRLVNINFVRANAQRLEEGDTRRIDLTYAARIEL
jgi:hypothetical protein